MPHLQDLFEFAELTLQLSVVLLQQAHSVLQPGPVFPQHGRLRQHLRLAGVHVEAAQRHVGLVEGGGHAGQARHLTADYLEVVVLLLQVGVLQLQLPRHHSSDITPGHLSHHLLDHQLQLLPLLRVDLQRHLHRAVRDGLIELTFLEFLTVN